MGGLFSGGRLFAPRRDSLEFRLQAAPRRVNAELQTQGRPRARSLFGNGLLKHALGHPHQKPIGYSYAQESTEEPLAVLRVERKPVGDSENFSLVPRRRDSLNTFKIPAKIAGNQASKHEGESLDIGIDNLPEELAFEFFRTAIEPFTINSSEVLIASG